MVSTGLPMSPVANVPGRPGTHLPPSWVTTTQDVTAERLCRPPGWGLHTPLQSSAWMSTMVYLPWLSLLNGTFHLC